MAVIGATQLEPVNVLGSYVQGLEAGRGARKQRAADEAAIAEAARAAELRNFLSTADLTKPDVQNQLMRFGKPGAEMAASFADIAGKRATAEKTGLEAQGLRVKMADENYGRFQKVVGDFAYGEAPPTKDQVLDSVDFLIAQGAIAPQFRDYAVNMLPDDPVQLQAALKQQFLTQIPPAERAKLFVPRSEEVFAQDLAERAAGASRMTVAIPSEKEFSGAIGKSAAGRLDKYRDSADSALKTIETSRQLAPLLDDPKFISGTFADARLALARAAGIDVASTEAYFAAIGQQVAERITAFGAGTGLSDADREFAKSIAGGNPVTTAQGIRDIIRINNESARNVINKYNTERNRLGQKSPEVLDYYPEISVSRQIKRTGTLNGRRVVEYDDGSLEYAN